MSRSPKRPPAMMDVAALAGVSHQTVSRVVNGTGKVAPQTRERVLAAIGELGYRRNSVARALVTRKSGILGIITTTSVHYGPASTLVAIEVAAREAGYFTGVTALEDFSRESLTEAIDYFLGLAVEAIVVIAPMTDIAEIVESIGAPVPIIAVSAANAVSIDSVRFVRGDQLEGARMAVRHLIELGHTDIAHVAGPEGWFESQIRREGWLIELRAAGLPIREAPYGAWEACAGFEAGKRLIAEGLPTAVFAANDLIALGLMRAFWQAGVSVPDEVSIVGFDDEPASRYFQPSLTTVRQDFTDLAQNALLAIRDAINGIGDAEPIVRPTELIIRDSTAAPRH
ncbi:LacI family DNA-binding transcriptional regulator [Schaalia sp. ZJ405]|uniref:LacI family DNA-binding transcriptional regulator n=1 Tax=Schaalia sp. ZJ405 TaxID=2709403 RepID=UPI001E5E386A|nr:LacI family DNA-binding transcriptional regulator [Schaalia sp. ZJ405]